MPFVSFFLVPFVACLDASASVELDVPCYRVDRAGGLDVAGPAGRGYTYSTGIAGVLLGGPRIALSGMRHDDELGTGTGWAIAESWQANAAGLMLLATALAYIPLVCYFLIRGRWSRHGWLSLSLALCLSVCLLVALGQWLERIMASKPF